MSFTILLASKLFSLIYLYTLFQSEDDDSLVSNDKDIRDYLEVHTLLPVSNPIAEPGPSGTDTDVAPPSSSLQQTEVHLRMVEKMPSSDIYQPSRNVDTTNIMNQSEISNELAKKRELDVLVEMFPNLWQEQVEQALESAGSDLEKAINILLEDNHTGVFMHFPWVNYIGIHQTKNIY